jgi:hypothetical protein
MSRRVIQLVHCNKVHRYSITAAHPSSDSGSDNPSASPSSGWWISSTVVPWMTGASPEGAHNSNRRSN